MAHISTIQHSAVTGSVAFLIRWIGLPPNSYIHSNGPKPSTHWELRVPIHLYSFTTIIVLGFYLRHRARTLDSIHRQQQPYHRRHHQHYWRRDFGFPKYLIAYLHGQGVTDGVEKYGELKQLSGYDPQSMYKLRRLLSRCEGNRKCWSGVAGDSSLRRGRAALSHLRWLRCKASFNRFAFLALLTNIFESIDDPDWTSFEHPGANCQLWTEKIHSLQHLAFFITEFPAALLRKGFAVWIHYHTIGINRGRRIKQTGRQAGSHVGLQMK